MRKRMLVAAVLVLTVAFSLIAPAAALADGGSAGPFYLGIIDGDTERYVRGGRVLQESDFGPNFRPRAGDQIFWSEALYHSTGGAAKGTRAGRTIVSCQFVTARTTLCDGVFFLRDRGTIYVQVAVSDARQFLAAVTGGTREFNSARGVIAITGISDRRSLYELRLR